MDDLVKEFVDETMDSLSELDLDLVKLEQDPTNQELLGKIFRLMHTIKGTCGFIGLSRLEKTAHAGENLLDNFRNGKMDADEKSMTLLFMCIDRVRYLLSEVNSTGSEPTGNDQDIISEIEKNIQEVSQGGNTNIVTDHNAHVIAAEPQHVEEEPKLEQKSAEASTSAPDTTHNNAAEKGPEFLRVQMSVLEDLVNMLSELVLTRNQLLQLIRAEETSPLTMPLQRLNRIVSDLQDSIMKTRMQPIGNAWSKLPRIARDLATEMKKKIALEMKGEDTELDRQVLDMIKDPLTHMIRNSCDHGIETPAERIAAGKPEQGTIKICAYHEGGFIIIKIEDDGRGLDHQKIAKKALEKNLITEEELTTISEKQILSLIMRPGFSTAEHVTNVSGRGVGMDVVRSNIEKIGGSIDMESRLGKGTSFSIQIPLTLAIISALIIEIDKQRYAIPQMNIQELVSVKQKQSEKIEFIDNKPVLRLRERIIPLLDSRFLLGIEKDASVIDFTNKLIAVVSAGSSYYGIIVDQIFDTEEVVIKSMSSVLSDIDIFSGNTILGDGQVIMIFDPLAIARKFNVEKDTSQQITTEGVSKYAYRSIENAPMLVFKAGEGAHKAVPLAIISRLQVFDSSEVSRSADKYLVQFNENLMQLSYIDPQTQKMPDGSFTTIVLSDDRSKSSLGLIIDDVVDIVEGALDLSPSSTRPGILGSMILNTLTVDIIDIAYYLGNAKNDWYSMDTHSNKPFVQAHLDNTRAKHHEQSVTEGEEEVLHAPEPRKTSLPNKVSRNDRPSILLVDDSMFFRNMLYPILSAAGYVVTLAEDPIQAIGYHDKGLMFDVILSDIEMPNMDGYEFVERMRDNSSWKNTPFIAITSHNTPADIEYGYKKGFDQYIGKFNKDELVQALKSVHHEA